MLQGNVKVVPVDDPKDNLHQLENHSEKFMEVRGRDSSGRDSSMRCSLGVLFTCVSLQSVIGQYM